MGWKPPTGRVRKGVRKGQGKGVVWRPECAECGAPVPAGRKLTCGPGCRAVRQARQLKERTEMRRAAHVNPTCRRCGDEFVKDRYHNRRIYCTPCEEFVHEKWRREHDADRRGRVHRARAVRDWLRAVSTVPEGLVGVLINPVRHPTRRVRAEDLPGVLADHVEHPPGVRVVQVGG